MQSAILRRSANSIEAAASFQRRQRLLTGSSGPLRGGFDARRRPLPNNLLVYHIVETREWLTNLLSLLHSFDVYFVGIHCPLAEFERRELVRGDRTIGESETISKPCTIM
jgi:hypothetical protein